MRPSLHDRPSRGPILVLDPGMRHSVAAVRGLGRAGWDVIVAGADAHVDALAGWSRFGSGPYERIPDPHGAAGPFGDALADLVERRGVRAIVPITDATIARLRGLGLAVPTVPRMDASLDRLIDKVDLARVCRDAEVMYPRTWATLPDAPAGGWPRIVKPRRTAVAGPNRVVDRTGAAVVSDVDEEAAAVAALGEEGLEPIVQERVERAGKVNVSIVRQHGRTCFRIAYRVLLEYPPQGGQAAALITIDPNNGIGARAIAAAERVCDAAGYRGLANVEFYVQGDGSLCLIEVNARVWGSVWLPERLGLRPVERAVLDALDCAVGPPLDYPLGRRFHRPSLEARWLVARRSERGPAADLARIVRPRDTFNLVSVSDPLPLVLGVRRILAAEARELIGNRNPR